MGNESAHRFYKRVISFRVFGTFDQVPEAAENWQEYARAVGKDGVNFQNERVKIYREEDSNYFKVLYKNGQEVTMPFLLNKQYDIPSPAGQSIKVKSQS